MLKFVSIENCEPGTLFKMLKESYSGLFDKGSNKWKKEVEKWRQSDKSTFENPETVGKCVFLSSHKDEFIGFASYDPRNAPDYGIVGQNCILPKYRGKGYGKLQIIEVLKRLKEKDLKKAKVTTGQSKFFVSAQKMYKSLGFKEVRRREQGEHGVIDYELEL